ncbi:MAG: segregation/condensation protein A [Phycisphaerae bacterium]|nr:segregation/condensation protein A [Phycisphaerae bacterium]
MDTDYRVQLDVYNGPLDLLLYLIRREEVDIHDIPIARITEQYVAYVDMLKALDPNLAGEFLVLATHLMEIKTRMLLPAPETAAGDEETDLLDPRAELVRQLLEYKAFKDAAGDLAGAAEDQARRFPRAPVRPPSNSPDDVDLDDVQVWDLFDAFSKLMESIGHRPTHHEVIYEDTPIELHAEDIVDRLRREGPMTFSSVFAGRTGRGELIGLFLALLELVRQRRIRAAQEDNFREIRIHIVEEAEGENRETEAGHQESETADGNAAPEDGQRETDDDTGTEPSEGQYVSDRSVGSDDSEEPDAFADA